MRFLDFAQQHGLMLRDVIADGRPHRVRTEDHPKRHNGAYLFDGLTGWVQNWAVHTRPQVYRPDTEDSPPDAKAAAELRRRAAADRIIAAQEAAKRHWDAAKLATQIVAQCRWGPHEYLTRKGFKYECGLLKEDRLIVPMRDCIDYSRIMSVQSIVADGTKKFLPGGRAKGTCYKIGTGMEHWLCEGYATALSIRSALAELHRQAMVIVCFSAGNLPIVANQIDGRRYVVADNDASGVGKAAAESTGLPWVMPPTKDANDHHQAAGVRALAELLRTIL